MKNMMVIAALMLVAGLGLATEQPNQSWRDNPMRLGNNAANELFEQQQYEEALKQYLDYYGQKADQPGAAQDPDVGALAYNIGNTYAVLGDAEKAQEFYEKALQSGNPEAMQRANFNLGNLNMGAQNPGEAVKKYIDYLKANPEDVDAKRNLELALRMLEQQQQQQQNQENQDQENQDQENQDQENQDQQQQNQDQQNQDQNQDQQNQDQQNQQNQDQENQDQQDQNQQDQGEDQQEEDQQDQEKQQNQDEKDQKEQEKQQQAQQQEQNQDKMSDAMKEQILQALKEQEMHQQKEFQKRKIGTTKRRAKDW